MKIYIAHSNDFDYKNRLYTPLRESGLNNEYEIFLPHENGRHEDSNEVMAGCDLVIAEVSVPSTGEGIELGRAEAAGIPILCISENGAKISSALQYITKNFLEYSDAEDMVRKLDSFLKRLSQD